MSGFQHAPITKGCILGTAALSLVVALADVKPYMHIQFIPHMRTYHQYWRLLVHPLAYTNSVDLLMGVMALYHMGIHVERAFGSRKFGSFIFLSSLISTLLSFALVVILGPITGLNVIPAGSYAVLGAIWWQYHRIVPALYTINIFGLQLSNKTTTYLYPTFVSSTNPHVPLLNRLIHPQLLLHQFPISVLAAAPGILTSMSYTSSPRLTHFHLPLPLQTLLTRLLSPLIDPQGSAPPRRADRVLPGEISESAQQGLARMREVERAVRVAVEREGVVRRRVGEEVAERRRRLVGVLEGLEGGATPVPMTQRQPEPDAVEPTSEVTGNPFRVRSSRFGLGGWVDRAGEAVGIRTPAAAAAGEPGTGTGVATGESTPRAPSQAELDSVVGMFPNLSRDEVVRALQRSNYNTALAVELLLQDGT